MCRPPKLCLDGDISNTEPVTLSFVYDRWARGAKFRRGAERAVGVMADVGIGVGFGVYHRASSRRLCARGEVVGQEVSDVAVVAASWNVFVADCHDDWFV